MQKRILSMVLMVMMLVTMLPANISFAAEGILAGSGTLSSPYLVSDAADLEKLADAKPGEVYKLTSDITLSRDFKTISSFKGILDGNGKTISGIDVMCEVTYVTTSSDTGYYQNSVTGQLFGTIDENAAVYNLILDKPKFSNLFKDMPSGKTNIHQYKLGMLANENNGIIDSVTINEINAILSPKRSGTTGSGFGSAEFGGMVYNNNGTIVNSKVQKGAIHTSEGSGVDGIVRNNYGTVASTISTVSVDINTWSGYNGIRSTYLSLGVGRNYGTIHNVWTGGTVSKSTIYNINEDSAYNGYVCGVNEAGSKVVSCFFIKASSDAFVTTGVGKNNGNTADAQEVSSIDTTKYDIFAEASDIKEVKKMSDTSQPNIIIYRDSNGQFGSMDYFYGDREVVIPTGVNDDYYCESWTSSDNEVVSAGSTYNCTKSVEFTAGEMKGKYYPVFNETVILPPSETASFPAYEHKWKQVGSDEFVSAPDTAVIEAAGGIKVTVTRLKYGTTLDTFTDSYTGALTVGNKFCYRYTIPENDTPIKSGTFDMYITYMLGSDEKVSNPTFKIDKISVTEANYADYITLNIPDSQKYLAGGAYDYPSAEAKTDAAVKPSGTITIGYKDSEGNELGAAPTEVGKYTVLLSIAGDSNFYAANKLEVGTFEIIKQDVTITAETAPKNAVYGDDVTVTVKVLEGSSTESVNGGTIELTANGEAIGSAKSVSGSDITFTVSGASVKNYDCTLSYSGNESYNSTSFVFSFNVDRKTPAISLSSDSEEIDFGEDVKLYVTAPDKDNISFTDSIDSDISSKISFVEEQDGKYVYAYARPKSGVHKIKAVYSGNSNYNTASSTEVNLTVNKIDASVSLDVKDSFIYKEQIKGTVSISDNLGSISGKGSLNIYLVDTESGLVKTSSVTDNVNYPVSNFEFSLSDVDRGTYKICAEYIFDGDSDINNINKEAKTITISKKDLEIGDFSFTIPTNDIFKVDSSYNAVSQNKITITPVDPSMGAVETLYSRYDGTTWEAATNEVPKNAGKYRVIAKVSENANFNDGEFVLSDNYIVATREVTANDINIRINGGTELVFGYDGDAKAAAVTGKGDFTVSNIRYAKENEEGALLEKATAAPAAPGKYHVFISVNDSNGNYTEKADFDVCTFEITKSPIRIDFDSTVSDIEYEERITVKGKVVADGANAAVPTGAVTAVVTDENGGTAFSKTMTVEFENGAFTLNHDFNIPADSNYVVTVSYGGDENYKAKNESTNKFAVTKKKVKFSVAGTEQLYAPGEEKKITVQAENTKYLTGDKAVVKYYRVDENEDALASTTPTSKTVAAGRYLYVISFNSPESDNYEPENEYIVTGTDIPDFSLYGNVGFMDIKAGSEAAQKPIYFASGLVNKKTTDLKFTNVLTNPNASVVTYQSSDTSIAEVDASGEVTIKKAGSVTIMATSEKTGTTPVYASYVLNISKETVTVKAVDASVTYGEDFTGSSAVFSNGLSEADFGGSLLFKTNYSSGKKVGTYTIEPYGLTSDTYEINYESAVLTVNAKVLTESDFTVSAKDKTYDKTDGAEVSVSTSVANIKAYASGKFEDAKAGENKTVTYEISEITGKDAENYELSGGKITGSTTASIGKAKVSVICASITSKTHDGNVQSVDISAMANGSVFTDYSVQYEKDGVVCEPIEVGTYSVKVVLNDEDNYELDNFTAQLIIKSASQEEFSIEDIPQTVYYGDSFTVSALGASGDVSYEIAGNATIDENGLVSITGTGKITITATSKKAGYSDKKAVRTFNANKRMLEAYAVAQDREYNAKNDVLVDITLSNIVNSDEVSAKADASMVNSDAGNGKLVYVSNIVLEGAKKDLYTVASSTQTTVDIFKKKITGFEFTASDKKYDKTTSAEATVTSINGVLTEDKDMVSISGSAAFENANAGVGKTVTYTAQTLSGTKSANYEFESEQAKVQSTTASIGKAKVSVICTSITSKTYDGNVQSVDISAMANGSVFTDYSVQYEKDGAVCEPIEVGTYSVKVVLNDEDNYELDDFTAKLTIKSGSQEVFSIEDIPQTVYYGDSFTVSTLGASGDVSYEIAGNATIDGNGLVSITGTGKITITATSKKAGYSDKKTVKTFNANKRMLEAHAVAQDREYNAKNDVLVDITLSNIVNSDEVYASADGAMLNSDAGNGKLVYVSNIALAGANSDLYTLSSSSIQTTVDIDKAKVSGFEFTAYDKKYDKTAEAQTLITSIEGILIEDKDQVSISGNAEFEDENSGEDKQVTYTAYGLTGVRGANYEFESEQAKVQSAIASIEPINVSFIVANTSFVYDGDEKNVSISAFVTKFKCVYGL